MDEETHDLVLERWNDTVHNSSLTVLAAQKRFAIAGLKRYLNGDRVPNAKNRKRVEEMMEVLKETKRIPYSPVWGYATEEQVAELSSKGMLKPGRREAIMAAIAKQTRTEGKVA